MESVESNPSQNLKKSLKATSLFGGVQIFGILTSIIRNKFVAILIGPAGVGIVELYSSTIRLIKSISDFSISVTAVREISIAFKTGDEERLKHVNAVVSRIVWFTGLLGFFICFLGSPLWSKLTFGNYDYTIGFLLVSSVLLLNQLQAGKSVLLQGTENYKYLAVSGLIGNVLGLFTTIPIYYAVGVDGVVAVLIVTALSSYILSFYYAQKVNVKNNKISYAVAYNEGRVMLKQGFLLSLNYLSSTAIFYVLRLFIVKRGGVDELGIYSAGFLIVTNYVGMVYSAMNQEYFPRISSLSVQNDKFNSAVNDQIYLTLLIIGPLVAVFFSFSDQLLTVLYSDKFTGASLFMTLSMLGVVFQAPAWCMGYAFLAKGDNKAYLFYETIMKSVKLLLDIVFYLYFGLVGLGFSFVLSYIYYAVQCSYVCKQRYGLFIRKNIVYIIIGYCISGVVLIGSNIYLSNILRFTIGSFFIFIAIFFSYHNLNKIIDVKELLRNKIFKH